MGTILLPGDPDFDKPLVMGDPYKNHLTPKLALEKKIAEADQDRSNGTFRYANTLNAYTPTEFSKFSQAAGGIHSMMTSPQWFSILHTPQSWQTPSRRREIYNWCRFLVNTEPKVAAAIDFYSRFPMNNFTLECTSRKIKKWFEHYVVNRLNLNENFKMISNEYFTLGDVFIHMDVQCEKCRGSSVDPETGELCNHPGGSFRKISILNPDWMEVQKSALSGESNIVMIPDEELKRIVFLKQPKEIYDALPDKIKELVVRNQPIPLSNRTTSHLKHMECGYAPYGTSLIRRLFTTLAYKTKIMTANWIVAERLIIPVRVVKIGSDQRPASTADIADVQQQLAAVYNEPNITIVSHHAFDMEWYGASGKILQVTQELEHIDKEILDGMMLNQALLNGEGPAYSGVQVGVEVLIRRIEAWRHSLAAWAEERIFKPIAEMQGFIDEEASEEIGETIYLYPRIKWNDLEIKDKSQWYQILMQLHDKQVISTQTLMEELDMNYDQEVQRMRYEQVQVGPQGGQLGGGMGGGAAGGMGLGGGGGPMGGDPSGGMGMPGGGAPPGAPGGGPMDMGGGAGAPGGMAPMGPMASGGKIVKKGKSNKNENQQQVPMPMIKLTRIEQEMARMLIDVASNLNIQQNNVRVQFPVENPRGGKPFVLDFAIPAIKIAVESDGQIFHQGQQKIDDQERDYLLAQRGWTVLRFDDKTIEGAPHAVKQTISSHIQNILSKKHHKKASVDNPLEHVHLYMFKGGQLKNLENNWEEYMRDREVIYAPSFVIQNGISLDSYLSNFEE